MKKILPLFLILALPSCCIRPRGFAQSDRFDTHRPAIVECVPCNGLANRPEHHLTLEGYGKSGYLSAGFESGYNFNSLRIYGSADYSWWPSPVRKHTLAGQIGIVGFNPNKTFRPEAGIGIGEWIVSQQNQTGKIHPGAGFPAVENGKFPFWNYYGGVRMNVPYSNIVLSLRVYRLIAFEQVKHNGLVPGLTCGFRF